MEYVEETLSQPQGDGWLGNVFVAPSTKLLTGIRILIIITVLRVFTEREMDSFFH